MIYKLLSFEEGFRRKPYYCSEGYPTIGIGTRIGPKNAPLHYYEFSVNEETAKCMLEEKLRVIYKELGKHNWFTSLDVDRCDVIVSMAYQLGLDGLFKFKKMIAAIDGKDFDEASKQALDSLWAKQTPIRACRHSDVIRTGNLKKVYEGLIQC